MRFRSVGRVTLYGVLALTVIGVGCKHVTSAVPSAPTTSVPSPTRPTVTLQASPTIVRRGESATLTWSSSNASSLTLTPDVGNVAPQGSTSVSPTDSINYSIAATGPGGSADASVRITVTVLPPSGTAAAQPTLEDLFIREVQDAYFDYDKADIRADARNALSKTADFLRSYPQVKVVVEGHCDERGSTEYNLALGDRRAQAAKDFMISLGVAADRLQALSYGKERPFCNEQTEACFKQNRRAHFSMAK